MRGVIARLGRLRVCLAERLSRSLDARGAESAFCAEIGGGLQARLRNEKNVSNMFEKGCN